MSTTTPPEPLAPFTAYLPFETGQTMITPGAVNALGGPIIGHIAAAHLIIRHRNGDWGKLDEDDTHANEEALRLGNRIISNYTLADGERIWVITEWDRSYTTVLLPEEY